MKLSAVHLIHHTHMDIGYTDLPGEVLEQHLAHLDRALALCQGNGDLPEDRQFRWACESALLVQEYCCRPRAHRKWLLHALLRVETSGLPDLSRSRSWHAPRS